MLHKVMEWPQCLWVPNYLLWIRHKVTEWRQYTGEFMKADCRKVPQWVHRQWKSSYTKCKMNNNMYHWDWLGTEVLICIGADGVGCTEVTGVICITSIITSTNTSHNSINGASTTPILLIQVQLLLQVLLVLLLPLLLV